MYVDKTTVTRKNGEKYTQYLLRTSKRQGKKTIKTTLLNITHYGVETCEAIRFALSNKAKLHELGIATSDLSIINAALQLTQEKPIGDVWLLYQVATKIGITAALGDSDEARLALWQIIARTIDQGSRLSAARLARNREIDFLQLGKITLQTDEAKLRELSSLDGCYCLTTNVSAEEMDKESVHARYKDLAMVEEAFRTCKTGHLELRPIYVRKPGRTRAHVFVVMLSYLLVRELREACREVDATVAESLDLLSSLCGVRVTVHRAIRNRHHKRLNVLPFFPRRTVLWNRYRIVHSLHNTTMPTA